jgi:hypothetical protein
MADVARRRPQNGAVDTERGVSPRYFSDVLVSSAMLLLEGFTTRKLTATYAPLERGGLK